MGNKETLDEYNSRLEVNNTDLENVLNEINNLKTMNLEELTVEANENEQIITPQEGIDGFSKVIVKATPYDELLQKMIYIEESGNNENGNYIKYNNGTMICYGQRPQTAGLTETLPSGGYRSGGLNFSFPVEFITTPLVVATSSSDVNDTGFNLAPARINTQQFSGFFWGNKAQNGTTHSVNYMAIGKWK